MRVNGVTRALVLCFVGLMSTSNLVESHRMTGLLGGLGPGTDPCPFVHGLNDIVPIKAATPVYRPTYYASETAINQAAEARDCAAHVSGGSNSAPAAPAKDQALSAYDLISLGAHTRVAPRFEPIGDLCYTHKPTVTPAYPGKRRLVHGHVHHRHGYGYGRGHDDGHHSCSCYGPHSYAYEGDHFSESPVHGDGYYGPGWRLPYAFGVHGSGSGVSCGSGSHEPGVTYGSIESPAPLDSEHSGPYGPGPGCSHASSGVIPGSPFGALSVYTSLSPSSRSYIDIARPAYGAMTFKEQQNIYTGSPTAAVPADAVSLSLAYKNVLVPRMHRKKSIPEERLSYGHRTTPTDGHVQQTPTITVPEERLVTVDKPIVELKPPHPCGPANEEDDTDQEAAMERERQEQAEAEAAQAANADPSSIITYGDLGYGLVGPSKNRFVPKPISNGGGDIHRHGGGIPCGPVGKPLSDYRPGQVIVNGGDHVDCGSGEDSHSVHNEEPYDAPASYEKDEPWSHENHGYGLYHGNQLSGSRSGSGFLSRLWAKASSSDGCSH